MRDRLVAFVGAFVLVAILPGWANAATASVPVLHGDQTFSAATMAARMIVTVPAPIRLPGKSDCFLSRTAKFTGTARQASVFLTSLPISPDSAIIWISKVTLSGESRTYDSMCTSTQVPAGRYVLQYVHTPGTSRVRLTLPGLAGVGTLHVNQRDDSVMAELPSVLSSPADSATSTWGTRRELATQGSVFTLGVIAAGSSDRGADSQGDCLLSQELAAVPDAVAYAPGCPGGESGSRFGFTGIETWQATLTSNIPAGSYGAGYWFIGTPTHRPLGAVSVWLTNLAA
jgi:hypothetical protein